jgi:hypothetical protein
MPLTVCVCIVLSWSMDLKDTSLLSLHHITMILLHSAVADSPLASFFDFTNWDTYCLFGWSLPATLIPLFLSSLHSDGELYN